MLGWCGGLTVSPACLCTTSGLGQVLLASLLPSGRASFGHRSASFKDYMLSAFPSISTNLTGQEFHGTAYHDPEDKTSRHNKQSYGHCRPKQCQSHRASRGGEAFKRSAQALFPATSSRLLFSRYSIFLAVIFTRRSARA